MCSVGRSVVLTDADWNHNPQFAEWQGGLGLVFSSTCRPVTFYVEPEYDAAPLVVAWNRPSFV